MGLSVSVTPSEAYPDGTPVTRAMLRNAASPTVNITGTVAAADIAAGGLTAGDAAAGTWFHATASGSSNAYVLDLTPNTETPADGTLVRMRANHTNTGAATLNVDGAGALAIVKLYNQALVAGDIRAGQECILSYDATTGTDVWQLLNPVGNPAFQYVTAATTGSAKQWNLTGLPANTAYRDGMLIGFEAPAATTDLSDTLTVNLDSLGVKNVRKDNEAAVIKNDILSGQVVMLIYDSSEGQFWLVSPYNVLNRFSLGTLADATSLTVDMDVPHQKLTMTGSVSGTRSFITSNRSAGATEVKSVSLKILNSAGGAVTLSPHGSWKFIGGAAGNRDIADGKTAILSLTSYSTGEADVVAAYAVEP